MINGSITLIADDSQKMGLVNLEDEMKEFEGKVRVGMEVSP